MNTASNLKLVPSAAVLSDFRITVLPFHSVFRLLSVLQWLWRLVWQEESATSTRQSRPNLQTSTTSPAVHYIRMINIS